MAPLNGSDGSPNFVGAETATGQVLLTSYREDLLCQEEARNLAETHHSLSHHQAHAKER